MNRDSSTPIQDVSTKKITYEHFKASFTESPLCYERWNAVMSISEMQWKELWSIPSVHSITSYQKDVFWKTLHRVLPTQHKRITQKYLCQHGVRIARSTDIFKQLLLVKS